MVSFNFVFMFLAGFVMVQLTTANPRISRDVLAGKPQDAVGSIQRFFGENFQLKNLIGNIKLLSGKLQTRAMDLGEKILAGTKNLVNTIQQNTDITMKPASNT